MVKRSGRDSTTPLKQMTNFQKAVASLACGAIAVLITTATYASPSQASPVDEAARQFEQSYCFTASGAERWKACR